MGLTWVPLKIMLTNFMELNPSSEAASYAATQELSNILWRRGMRIGYWWESQKERDH
jgi:hypothetical protein